MTCMFSVCKKCSVYSTHKASDNSAVAKSHPASAGNACPAPKRKPKGKWSGKLQRNRTVFLKTLLWKRALEPWGARKISALSKEGELELVLLLLLWAFIVKQGEQASLRLRPQLVAFPSCSRHLISAPTLCILSVMEQLNLTVMNLIHRECETVPFSPDSLPYSLWTIWFLNQWSRVICSRCPPALSGRLLPLLTCWL